MGAVPVYRAAQTFFEVRLRLEAKFSQRAGGIERAARLPVGFVCVPDQPALVAGQPLDQLSQVFDADLHTRTQVHRLVLAESVIMAGIGTLVGGALGVWFGAGLFTVLSGNIAAATIHLPWLQLIVLAAGGALAGVAAGWWPARRAARQPILDAVGYE